jgi:hypothetical protein
MMAKRRRKMRGLRILIPKGRWRLVLLLVIGIPTIAASAAFGYYYVEFSRIIEARLHGERDRVIPRVFARPFSLHTGQGISATELIARLNDLGYTERARAERPGEFALEPAAITICPRGGDQTGKRVRVTFPQERAVKASNPPTRSAARILEIDVEGRDVDEVVLDAPMLSPPSSPAHARNVVACRSRRFPRACGRPCLPSRIAGSTAIQGSIPSALPVRSGRT